jgi:hypothetical protein
LDNLELLKLLGQADRELGRLDRYSGYVPNPDLFVRMHVLKEATQSNRFPENLTGHTSIRLTNSFRIALMPQFISKGGENENPTNTKGPDRKN